MCLVLDVQKVIKERPATPVRKFIPSPPRNPRATVVEGKFFKRDDIYPYTDFVVPPQVRYDRTRQWPLQSLRNGTTGGWYTSIEWFFLMDFSN